MIKVPDGSNYQLVCSISKHSQVQQLQICIDSDCDSADADVTGGEWRLKYERAIREIEFTKKRLQQEFDDKLEVEQQNKRQLERRVRESSAVCSLTDKLHPLKIYYTRFITRLS